MSLLRRLAPPQIMLAAAVPFVGYALAYVYERGYTGRYGIPAWMTRVSLMQAVIASATVALLVAATPAISRVFARIASQWIARILIAPAAALVVAVWAYSETVWVRGKHLVLPVALIVAFGGFAAFRIYRSIVAPLMTKGGTWVQRLQSNAIRGEQRPSALAWLGHRTRWTLAVLVVALLGAHWVGEYQSRNERRFLVTSSAPTCVAVRRNADGIICAIADLTNRRVVPRLRVLPPQTKENLTVANLSPLRSPFDADRKLFAPSRAGRTSGTMYSPREEAPVTQAGRPAATTKKPATTTRRTTTKKPTTTTKKRTTTTRR